jgi:hypothetical protein
LLLIFSSLSIFLSLRRGHFYFGERGHFYFGLTYDISPLDTSLPPS